MVEVGREQSLLIFGIPKGSLEEATRELFGGAGFTISVSSRSYYPEVDDPELSLVLIRAQEMSRYVEDGHLDAGITGIDWVKENGSDVVAVATLDYNKRTRRPARWVLAVPEDSEVHSVEQLQGKCIATELVNVTREYLRRHNVEAEVEFSWGATEVKPPRLADAIVELSETGSSLRANDLRVVDTLLESYPQLIANRAAWDDSWKRQKIENIATLLQGALDARSMVGLKMNVRHKDLKRVVALLPALRNPTVSELYDKDWVAIETVIEEYQVRELIPELKKAGAQGIIEYSLNKLIR